MDSIYDDTDFYDLVAPPDAAMQRFYAESAGGPGRRVLELACGTGRITIPLAETGALVTGTDLSENMLARARVAAAERGVSADFLALDMRDFVLGRQFDGVVIAANSLLHLHSPCRLRPCLRRHPPAPRARRAALFRRVRAEHAPA